MEQLNRIWMAVRRTVRSRLFAVVCLAAATTVMAAVVSVNSRAITVTDGDSSRVVLTMHSDPYLAVSAAGVSLQEYDLLQVDPAAGKIDVNRAMTVEVQADGVSTLLHMTDGTVSSALCRADVSVGAYDTVSVDRDTLVTDGMMIRVDRVAYEEYQTTEAIAFETVTN